MRTRGLSRVLGTWLPRGAAAASLLVLGACGAAQTVTVTTTLTSETAGPSPTPTSSSPSPTPKATSTSADLLAVVTEEGPPGDPHPSVSITFFHPDGSNTPALVVPVLSTRLVTVAGGGVWLVDPSNHLVRAHPDGSTTAVTTLVPAPSDRAIAVSPDGSRWLWSVDDTAANTSSLWIGGTSTAARRLVSVPTPNPLFLTPVAWPASGPLVAHTPNGIGGRILYDDAFGAVDRVDVDSGGLTNVLPESCQFSDVSVDGTIACSNLSRGVRTFTLTFADGHTTSVSVPGAGEFGNARFDPQGRLLAIGYEITNGTDSPGPPQVTTDIVNLETGHHVTASHAGLTPEGWSPDGRLVASDRYGSAPTTYPMFVVDSSGTATSLQAAGYPVAVGAAS